MAESTWVNSMESGPVRLGLKPGSPISWDLGQVTKLLCASASSSVKWG